MTTMHHRNAPVWLSALALALFMVLAAGSDEDAAGGATNDAAGDATTSGKEAILEHIGTGSGHIYESIDVAASTYTTLAFDADAFRVAAYMMAGGRDELTPVMELDGTWEVAGEGRLTGRYNANGVEVSWTLSDDHTTLTNNMGGRFTRVSQDASPVTDEAPEEVREEAPADGKPVFGTYAYEDGSVALEFTVMGDSWTSSLLIKTGMEAYGAGGEPSYDNGRAVGSDLYDASGNFVIGRVEGDRLITNLGEQRVVLRRQ